MLCPKSTEKLRDPQTTFYNTQRRKRREKIIPVHVKLCLSERHHRAEPVSPPPASFSALPAVCADSFGKSDVDVAEGNCKGLHALAEVVTEIFDRPSRTRYENRHNEQEKLEDCVNAARAKGGVGVFAVYEAKGIIEPSQFRPLQPRFLHFLLSVPIPSAKATLTWRKEIARGSML
ncbi:unnamed protein product [Notodromas monacha]|uniref:Uncharacterized protein n=1 Tax=Notodromas monacha TaxID=399045 RepID=A0A7R9GAJ3_9CRUS|nr:unnamed protein product [Notodromas monacha]CAG0915444.1 unnamed protein product [Notodromas monacha]